MTKPKSKLSLELSYEDLTKLVENADGGTLDFKTAIANTFAEKYLKGLVSEEKLQEYAGQVMLGYGELEKQVKQQIEQLINEYFKVHDIGKWKDTWRKEPYFELSSKTKVAINQEIQYQFDNVVRDELIKIIESTVFNEAFIHQKIEEALERKLDKAIDNAINRKLDALIKIAPTKE